MKKNLMMKLASLICCVLLASGEIIAQTDAAPPIKSREVSDGDGIPVLIKHLPDWENARNRAAYILNRNDLQNALGVRPALNPIEFASGTEAVAAAYDSGKLLLIEFSTPQTAVDSDAQIRQKISENGQNVFYRKIGNYSVFLFDSTDESAANELFDQIKYEKNVQWLGEDPFFAKRTERNKVIGMSQVLVATAVWIVGGLFLAILTGVGCGYLYFRWREKQRAVMKEFSDAGGMTRLNLDGFTPAQDRLLKD